MLLFPVYFSFYEINLFHTYKSCVLQCSEILESVQVLPLTKVLEIIITYSYSVVFSLVVVPARTLPSYSLLGTEQKV